jgi:anti-anti-sigma factor
MSSYGIETREESDDGEALVYLTGELDLTNARELEVRLDEVAPADRRLVLDLNGVSFLDSAALHVLFKLARARGPESVVFVVDPAAHVASTVAIVGLPQVATVAASVEATDSPTTG